MPNENEPQIAANVSVKESQLGDHAQVGDNIVQARGGSAVVNLHFPAGYHHRFYPLEEKELDCKKELDRLEKKYTFTLGQTAIGKRSAVADIEELNSRIRKLQKAYLLAQDENWAPAIQEELETYKSIAKDLLKLQAKIRSQRDLLEHPRGYSRKGLVINAAVKVEGQGYGNKVKGSNLDIKRSHLPREMKINANVDVKFSGDGFSSVEGATIKLSSFKEYQASF